MNLNKIKIRKATLQDVQMIVSLTKKLLIHQHKQYDKTIITTWPLKFTKDIKDAITKSNAIALVALDKGKIVGYFIGYIKEAQDYRTFKKIAEADNSFIIKEYRRKGIGQQFMGEFIRWAKTKKVNKAKVIISAQNIQSIGHAKKAGFNDYEIVLEKKL